MCVSRSKRRGFFCLDSRVPWDLFGLGGNETSRSFPIMLKRKVNYISISRRLYRQTAPFRLARQIWSVILWIPVLKYIRVI